MEITGWFGEDWEKIGCFEQNPNSEILTQAGSLVFAPTIKGWQEAMCTRFIVCVVVLTICLTGLGAPPDSSEVSVDRIFSGGIPQSIVELQAMQRRQQELADRLKPFAVAVRIGPAQGSGVLVSADGYVLTAAHVAGQPGRLVLAFLSDGRAVRGRTLGVNRSMDAGLLKLDPPDNSDATFRWPHAEMGRAAQVKPGQWVMALGHPGGYDSDRPAVVRLGRVLAVRKNHIKTDCKLVGGDSGGPLFDMQGNVIGIHSRIGNSLVNNMHAPVDAYRSDWERLLASQIWGHLPGTRPFIGVVGDPEATRALIVQVIPGGAADQAGIQVNDVIVEFGGARVQNFSSLRQLVRKQDPDDRVGLKVERNGEVVELAIVIGTGEE